MGSKKGKSLKRQRNWLLFGLIAVVVVGLIVIGSLSIPGVPDAPVKDETGVLVGSTTEDTTVTISNFDVENRGTATGEQSLVWVKQNGDWTYKGSVSDTSTTTASPGDTLRIMCGNNSEVVTGVFYPSIMEIDVVDKGTLDVNCYQKDQNSSAITVNYFNEDDGLINSDSDVQAIGADETVTVLMKLKATAEDYFGDGGIAVVFDAQTTPYTKVELLEGTKIGVPSQHTGLASSRAYAYEIPALEGSSTVQYNVLIEASSTEPTAVNGNITTTLYDKSWFVDAGSNEPTQDYNDEDNNDVGANNGYQLLKVS